MSEMRVTEWCGDCDGCGWVEGGAALKSQCTTCRGSGVVPPPDMSEPNVGLSEFVSDLKVSAPTPAADAPRLAMVDALTLAYRYLNGLAPLLGRHEFDEFQRRLLAVESEHAAALRTRHRITRTEVLLAAIGAVGWFLFAFTLAVLS